MSNLPPKLTLLEASIERRLEQCNPQKWERLNKAGTLREWLGQQADLATDAMNSLGPQASDDQRREMASQYLNPLTPEQEQEQEQETQQQMAWARNQTLPESEED